MKIKRAIGDAVCELHHFVACETVTGAEWVGIYALPPIGVLLLAGVIILVAAWRKAPR